MACPFMQQATGCCQGKKGLEPDIAVRKLRYSGAEVARYLGIPTSAVNKMANLEELPEIKSYIKLL